MMYRVYDSRTNETLFTGKDRLECTFFVAFNFEEGSDEHIWIEEIKGEGA